MKVLIVTGRFPEYGFKGDQLRVRQLVELLAGRHEVTVLTGGTPSSDAAADELGRLARVIVVATGSPERIVGALHGALRGRPLQVGWMTPAPLLELLARQARAHDVVIASTVRSLPEPLGAPVVLDHIDALSANLAQRARIEERPVLRLGALVEASLLRRHERRTARWSAAQLVVSGLDASALPARPVPIVVPHVVDREPPELPGAARDIDVIFTGNMAYPPNREAAEWLASAIVPRLRHGAASTRVVVAGRSADRLTLPGVEIRSDVPDLVALLRRARVAAVPLKSGTGVPNKLLEAAGAGAAIVSTSRAAAAAGLDVAIADSAEDFAAEIDRLLDDDSLRGRRAQAARSGLDDRRREVVAAQLDAILARVTGRD
jgi:polysaccharide biosynthesis protein PslH